MVQSQQGYQKLEVQNRRGSVASGQLPPDPNLTSDRLKIRTGFRFGLSINYNNISS
jgi:hypothetical protein